MLSGQFLTGTFEDSAVSHTSRYVMYGISKSLGINISPIGILVVQISWPIICSAIIVRICDAICRRNVRSSGCYHSLFYEYSWHRIFDDSALLRVGFWKWVSSDRVVRHCIKIKLPLNYSSCLWDYLCRIL